MESNAIARFIPDLAALITINVINSIGQEREKKSVSDMEVASRLSQKNNPTLKSRVYKL
ncbi:MAG: hypothetical protein Q8941_17210 [Bacteroidota bacterium]|nr:hypothetical protein [Bacteroidota bacterium]